MNSPEPKDVIEQWLRNHAGAPAIQIAMAIGFNPDKRADALDMISGWIAQPRKPFELRNVELSLRAFIDFQCAMMTDPNQDIRDSEDLSLVDNALLPIEVRAVINKAIGDQPIVREQALHAASSWESVRPANQSIYDWWIHRNQTFLKSLSQPPTK